MAIITQHGIRCTDRLVVTEHPAHHSGVTPATFTVAFDGEPIPGHAYSAAGAIRIGTAWLAERQRKRDAAEDRARAEAEREQAASDQRFLWDMAVKLGVTDSEMNDFIEIIGRRIKSC